MENTPPNPSDEKLAMVIAQRDRLRVGIEKALKLLAGPGLPIPSCAALARAELREALDAAK